MPKAISSDVSNVIVQALGKGMSRNQIAGVVGVSKRAVTRISTNLRKHGTPRAPPSGVKQGRPLRMTSAQAQAMVAWMAERDYTFYVKDLVQFLRESQGYQGCDGTVRRSLLRAGFKIKLPWHKSEITTWIPPAELPNFEDEIIQETETPSITEPIPPSVPSSEHTQIDPALEEASIQLLTESQNPVSEASRPDQPPLYPSAPPAPPQAATSPPKRRARSSRKVTDPASNDLENTVNSLQGEIARQQELIAQLQQQLAQQATQVQQQPSSPTQLQYLTPTAGNEIEFEALV